MICKNHGSLLAHSWQLLPWSFFNWFVAMCIVEFNVYIRYYRIIYCLLNRIELWRSTFASFSEETRFPLFRTDLTRLINYIGVLNVGFAFATRLVTGLFDIVNYRPMPSINYQCLTGPFRLWFCQSTLSIL